MESIGTLANKLMVIAPFVLLASIGVRARTANLDFDFVAYPKAENDDIRAYRGYVAEAVNAAKGSGLVQVREARRFASEWIAGAHDGTLKPLPQVEFADTTREGVKNEIEHANMLLANSLNLAAAEEAGKGQFDLAMKDSILAAKCADVTKFSDFASLSACSMVQRRSLMEAKELLPKVSRGLQQEAWQLASSLRSNGDQLSKIALKERELFLQYQLRNGVSLPAVEATQRVVTRDELTHVASLAATVAQMRSDFQSSRDSLTPQLLTDLRLGYLAALDTDRRIDELIGTPRQPISL